MRTVTLDILNDEAVKLLKNLEALHLIRFRRNKGTGTSEPIVDNVSLSDFSFAKSREILKDYKGSLSDTVLEERRDEL